MWASMIDLKDKYNIKKGETWAIVAGASEGLGKEWSRQLAKLGFNLIIIARRKKPLQDLSLEIEQDFPSITVKTLELDLANLKTEMEKLITITEGLDVGFFVYNAASAPIGLFKNQDLTKTLQVVKVNIEGPLVMLHTFLPRLQARGSGGAVLMSSFSGKFGTNKIATYAASKAFNTVLAEGLWSEYKGQIDIIACVAGAIRTPGFTASSNGKDAPGTVNADQVVNETLAALAYQSSPPTIIPGFVNRIFDFILGRLLPRTSAIEIIASNTKNLQS